MKFLTHAVLAALVTLAPMSVMSASAGGWERHTTVTHRYERTWTYKSKPRHYHRSSRQHYSRRHDDNDAGAVALGIGAAILGGVIINEMINQNRPVQSSETWYLVGPGQECPATVATYPNGRRVCSKPPVSW